MDESQTARMEREKVRKVRDRQQQRGRVRQMGASVDMGRGRHAQTRHGREYDWSKQHNRRVQTDRRRDAGGDDEHERQQPPRAVLGAARHERAECIEQSLAPATVADQEERGKEPDRRGQIAERLTRAIDADGAGGYEDHGCHYRRDRKSTRLNSSHTVISYAVFCLKKKNKTTTGTTTNTP